MAVTDATREALDLSKLQLPPGLPVTRLEAEDYIDSDGEPSLRILAVIDESVDLDRITGRDVCELKFLIRESLLRHGVALFPYISLAKPSELDDSAEGVDARRSDEMPIDQNTRDALDIGRLKLPASLQVIRLEPEDYTDSDGEPALRIYAVLDDDTDEDRLSGTSVLELKSAIHESLMAHGVQLFPYVFLVKESERPNAPVRSRHA